MPRHRYQALISHCDELCNCTVHLIELTTVLATNIVRCVLWTLGQIVVREIQFVRHTGQGKRSTVWSPRILKGVCRAPFAGVRDRDRIADAGIHPPTSRRDGGRQTRPQNQVR